LEQTLYPISMKNIPIFVLLLLFHTLDPFSQSNYCITALAKFYFHSNSNIALSGNAIYNAVTGLHHYNYWSFYFLKHIGAGNELQLHKTYSFLMH
jgi:hypothetical protein